MNNCVFLFSDLYQDKASVDKTTIGLLQQQALHSAAWDYNLRTAGDVGRWLNRRASSVPASDQSPLQLRQRSESCGGREKPMENLWKTTFFIFFHLFSSFVLSRLDFHLLQGARCWIKLHSLYFRYKAPKNTEDIF